MQRFGVCLLLALLAFLILAMPAQPLSPPSSIVQRRTPSERDARRNAMEAPYAIPRRSPTGPRAPLGNIGNQPQRVRDEPSSSSRPASPLLDSSRASFREADRARQKALQETPSRRRRRLPRPVNDENRSSSPTPGASTSRASMMCDPGFRHPRLRLRKIRRMRGLWPSASEGSGKLLPKVLLLLLLLILLWLGFKKRRKAYLAELQAFEHLRAVYLEPQMLEVLELNDGEVEHVVIKHDESTLHSNDYQNNHYWLKEGEQVLKKKGRGRLIMVSGFLCEHFGLLALPEDMVAENEKLAAELRLAVTDSTTVIYPDNKPGGDAYWNMEQMIAQLVKAILIARPSQKTLSP
ncbi:hypothetical protein B0H10DRAFT_2249903 [Mycena sp. CBHHK59/15]|nr:hypothetical protein B0H10DRAFT_2249903 [Mycena sp. CBHHK59/15]